MKFRLALAATTCVALPLAALAQPVTGPYVSLGAGTSIASSTNFSIRGAASGKAFFRPSYAFAGEFGYGFGNGFRVEIGGNFSFITAHEADISSGGVTTHTRVFGNEYILGSMVNALYDFDAGWLIYPYIGAGIGYQIATIKQDIGANNTWVGGGKGGFAYDVIGGVSYPLPWVRGLSATAEYRFMQMPENRNYAAYINGIRSTANVGQRSTHTFLLGLRYQLFNPMPMAPAPAPAPMAAPAPAPAKTYLVFFDWDKYNLTPRATQIIAQAASDSKTQNVTTLDVSGYTDTSGTPQYNQGLSERRAKAIAAELVKDGVPASEIEIHAYGETHLLVPTGPSVREPQNRRVEIVMQ